MREKPPRKVNARQISDWVLLLTAENDIQADLVSSLLESEGIPVLRRYPGFNHILKVIMGTVVPVELWVPAAMEEEARGLLREAEG